MVLKFYKDLFINLYGFFRASHSHAPSKLEPYLSYAVAVL